MIKRSCVRQEATIGQRPKGRNRMQVDGKHVHSPQGAMRSAGARVLEEAAFEAPARKVLDELIV